MVTIFPTGLQLRSSAFTNSKLIVLVVIDEQKCKKNDNKKNRLSFTVLVQRAASLAQTTIRSSRLRFPVRILNHLPVSPASVCASSDIKQLQQHRICRCLEADKKGSFLLGFFGHAGLTAMNWRLVQMCNPAFAPRQRG